MFFTVLPWSRRCFGFGFLLLNNWQYIIWDSIYLFSDHSDLPYIAMVWKPGGLKNVPEVLKMQRLHPPTVVPVDLFNFCCSKGSLGVFLFSLISTDSRLLWGSVSVEFHTLLYWSKQTPWRRSLSTNKLVQLFSENINLSVLLVVLSM